MVFFSAAVMSCEKTTPGTTDDGTTPEEPELLKPTEGVHAGGYYNGDMYGIGSDNFQLVLAEESVTLNDHVFDGDGRALLVDLNARATEKPVLTAGTYRALLEEPAPGASQDFTFLPGVDLGAWGITGTFVYTKEKGSDSPVYTMVTDGKISIEYKDDLAVIEATVKTDKGEHTFKCVVDLVFTDPSQGGGETPVEPEVPGVEITGMVHGTAEYYGQPYGDTGTDYANWTIRLAEESLDPKTLKGHGKSLQFEVNTDAASRTEIPEGTYKVFTEILPESFVPFSAVPAFIQDGAPLGTWYMELNDKVEVTDALGASSGTVTVARKGGDYTVSFELYDAETKTAFTGNYTGKLEFMDMTQQKAPVAAKGWRSLPARLHRFAK